MSTVQFATPSDIPLLVELGRQMHVQSRYSWMPYSASQTWAYLERIIPAKQHCVMVAHSSNRHEATICGVLVATVTPYHFSRDLQARVDYLYVLPPQRGTPVAMKLVTAFRRWASNREVAEITLPNTFGAGQGATAKLFSKLGMPPVGSLHSTWVQRK